MSEVLGRVAALQGEAGRTAREKFVAACIIRGDEPLIREMKQIDMWLDDIEDNPLAQKLVRKLSRRAFARLLVAHAKKLNLDPPSDAETLLMSCSEETLFDMANDLEHMTDFAGFIRSHGVEVSAGG